MSKAGIHSPPQARASCPPATLAAIAPAANVNLTPNRFFAIVFSFDCSVSDQRLKLLTAFSVVPWDTVRVLEFQQVAGQPNHGEKCRRASARRGQPHTTLWQLMEKRMSP
jgi:hypothetical protein